MAVLEDSTRIPPTWETFDPSAISGDTWKPSAHGHPMIRYIRSPIADGDYTLKFKAASGWGDVAVPGGSGDGAADSWLIKAFANNEPFECQIVEIDKAGSTAGDWEIRP